MNLVCLMLYFNFTLISYSQLITYNCFYLNLGPVYYDYKANVVNVDTEWKQHEKVIDNRFVKDCCSDYHYYLTYSQYYPSFLTNCILFMMISAVAFYWWYQWRLMQPLKFHNFKLCFRFSCFWLMFLIDFMLLV